jgi:uncharacterized protein YuzE
MTIYELIDRLKTANDKNNDILVIVRKEDNDFVAQHVIEAIEVEGNVFLDVIEHGEVHASNDEFYILKPNRKEEGK